jgi:hypothetical protein
MKATMGKRAPNSLRINQTEIELCMVFRDVNEHFFNHFPVEEMTVPLCCCVDLQKCTILAGNSVP